MQQVYIGLHHHRHGVDPQPFTHEVTEDKFIEWLGEYFEYEDSEYVEILGPYSVVTLEDNDEL